MEDLERALPFFAAVRPHEIEVIPVGGDLGPKVQWTAEGFQIKELIFDEAVNGFDVTLPGVSIGRVVAML